MNFKKYVFLGKSDVQWWTLCLAKVMITLLLVTGLVGLFRYSLLGSEKSKDYYFIFRRQN